jgi:ABC-type uncharacterized transport system permease subunit
VNILLFAIFALPAILYLGAWNLVRRAPVAGFARSADGDGLIERPPGSDAAGLMLVGALALHAGSIAVAIVGGLRSDSALDAADLRYGFSQALSVTMWLAVVMLWVESLRMRLRALQTVILPAAAVSATLPLFFPGFDLGGLPAQPLFVPHLLVGTLAYGVLLLAALHAGLMIAAERALHAPQRSGRAVFSRWLDQLPALLVLERLLFRLIAVGFVLLTLTALSGVIFSEQVFGRPVRWDHKTVFTLIAWTVFGALLLGRMRFGWRGRTALRLTLTGFVLLLLAYVGSHFVREVILRRY